MKKTSIKYGLRAGILMVVLSWASFYITKSSGVLITQIGSIVIIILALGLVPVAIRSLRQENEGYISFWMAFFTGAFTSLIPAIFMFISTIIFAMAERVAYAEWSLGDEAQGITGNARAVVMHPVEQGVIMFLMVLVLGTLLSMASAIVLHRPETQ